MPSSFLRSCCSPPPNRRPPAPPACRASEAARALDFWIGDWDVYAQGKLDGHDRVTREVNGCVVIERWSQADQSGEGLSLFAFDARKDLWTQTWVTSDTSRPGGFKTKVLRRRSADSATFQGEIEGSTGAVYYDRTTLTRNLDGSVRQLIEVSRNGDAWRTAYDALYLKAGSRPPA